MMKKHNTLELWLRQHYDKYDLCLQKNMTQLIISSFLKELKEL